MTARPDLVFVCTGNAARSVMAAAILRDRRPDLDVVTAGTHVIEGLPMSQRTRRALERFALSDASHRSRQFSSADQLAELIVIMEPIHMTWLRRHHPEVAPKSVSLPRLARTLERERPVALDGWLHAAGLADVVIEPWEEVTDPAGGEQDAFDRCMDELVALVAVVAELLP